MDNVSRNTLERFSRNTFDRLKHYVGVRLQQGVPIVDADWNELEDIRKYELQAFLKWFVGSGVPKGNDGFHILAATSFDNDFTIQGGDGTPESAGRCLVDGWDVIIESPLRYTEQELFVMPDLATDWNVDPLPPLTTPSTVRTDQVYLDVWEREVTALEDPSLVNEVIGLETCVRRKREWAVRVAEGVAEEDPLPEPVTGHFFYLLATLNRPAGQAAIFDENITDRRLTGLAIPSYLDIQQLSVDIYGPGYTLDHDGQPNLKVSLREAINSLLRGVIPTTPELGLTSNDSYNIFPKFLKAGNGDIWLFWTSGASGNQDIWYKRYDWNTGTWMQDEQLTRDAGYDENPTAVEDGNGNIWVFWQSGRSDSRNIWYNQYTKASGWQGDTNLTANANYNANQVAVCDTSGAIWVFWDASSAGETHIWSKRYIPGSSGWQSSQKRSGINKNNYSPYAFVGRNGDIWLFWHGNLSFISNYDITFDRYDHTSKSWDGNQETITNDSQFDGHPLTLEDANGEIWLFWIAKRGNKFDLFYRHRRGDGGNWSPDTTLTAIQNEFPQVTSIFMRVLCDSHNRLWVFWAETPPYADNYIGYKMFSSDVGWTRTVKLTTDPQFNTGLDVIEDDQGDLWVIWERSADRGLCMRRLTPDI